MKRLFAIVVCCSLCSAVWGQDIELEPLPNSAKNETSAKQIVQQAETTPSAQLIYSPEEQKPKRTRRHLRSEIAVSTYYNSSVPDENTSFGARSHGYYSPYGTPYTIYSETQAISTGIQSWSYCSIQYFREVGERLWLGALVNTCGSGEWLYKRTTEELLDFRKTNYVIFAPSIKWNFIESKYQWFNAYLGVGLNCYLSTTDTVNSSDTALTFEPFYYLGFAVGRRIYYFNEIGFAVGPAVGNIGLGIRF